MNHAYVIKIMSVCSASLLIVACGQTTENNANPAAVNTVEEPQAMTDDNHDGHDMAEMKGADTDHGAGTVIEVDVEGRRIKIDHEELTNIGMNAMTMFFGIAGDVALAEFEVGDDVRFMVKKGRDGSYRIMTMCNAAVDGEGCLTAMMNHNER